MTPRTKTATDQLGELQRLAAEAHTGVRSLEAERQEAERAVAEARAAVVASYADGAADEAARLGRDLAALEAEVSTWPARLEGPRLAAERAQAAVGRFAAEHLDQLLAEREALCVEARDNLAAALTDFTAAHKNWNQVATDTPPARPRGPCQRGRAHGRAPAVPG